MIHLPKNFLGIWPISQSNSSQTCCRSCPVDVPPLAAALLAFQLPPHLSLSFFSFYFFSSSLFGVTSFHLVRLFILQRSTSLHLTHSSSLGSEWAHEACRTRYTYVSLIASSSLLKVETHRSSSLEQRLHQHSWLVSSLQAVLVVLRVTEVLVLHFASLRLYNNFSSCLLLSDTELVEVLRRLLVE